MILKIALKYQAKKTLLKRLLPSLALSKRKNKPHSKKPTHLKRSWTFQKVDSKFQKARMKLSKPTSHLNYLLRRKPQ